METFMRAELRELDLAYKQLKFAYEDQARLLGRRVRPTKTELERAQDAVRTANDAFDAARRAVEAAVCAGLAEDE
jgi:outer membrane protein TolC